VIALACSVLVKVALVACASGAGLWWLARVGTR